MRTSIPFSNLFSHITKQREQQTNKKLSGVMGYLQQIEQRKANEERKAETKEGRIQSRVSGFYDRYGPIIDDMKESVINEVRGYNEAGEVNPWTQQTLDKFSVLLQNKQQDIQDQERADKNYTQDLNHAQSVLGSGFDYRKNPETGELEVREKEAIDEFPGEWIDADIFIADRKIEGKKQETLNKNIKQRNKQIREDIKYYEGKLGEAVVYDKYKGYLVVQSTGEKASIALGKLKKSSGQNLTQSHRDLNDWYVKNSIPQPNAYIDAKELQKDILAKRKQIKETEAQNRLTELPIVEEKGKLYLPITGSYYENKIKKSLRSKVPLVGQTKKDDVADAFKEKVVNLKDGRKAVPLEASLLTARNIVEYTKDAEDLIAQYKKYKRNKKYLKDLHKKSNSDTNGETTADNIKEMGTILEGHDYEKRYNQAY